MCAYGEHSHALKTANAAMSCYGIISNIHNYILSFVIWDLHAFIMYLYIIECLHAHEQ